MKIAIIPARGGSKRIPHKNIKAFFGKPMIAWSIEVAKESGQFDHIIVSTDDVEIAEIANDFGAEVPFIRPEELSNDFTGTIEVIAHATKWALSEGWDVEAICCIYATAPFIQVTELNDGWDLLKSGNWDYAFTVTDFATSILRSFKQIDDGGVEMFFPEHFTTRSQDLPVALHDAAQFYWGRPTAWLEAKAIFGSNSRTIVLPRWRVQDIDSLDDWKRAELLAPLIMGHDV